LDVFVNFGAINEYTQICVHKIYQLDMNVQSIELDGLNMEKEINMRNTQIFLLLLIKLNR